MDISPLWYDCENLDPWGALFGETLGRILVSVKPEDRGAFEGAMEGISCHYLGEVSEGDMITVTRGAVDLLSASMSELRDAWKGTLHGGGPR